MNAVNDDQSSGTDIEKLKNIRKRHPKNILISYLKINSIRNKFENLKFLLRDCVDVITIAETKIDESFPTPQFRMDGFHSLID